MGYETVAFAGELAAAVAADVLAAVSELEADVVAPATTGLRVPAAAVLTGVRVGL